LKKLPIPLIPVVALLMAPALSGAQPATSDAFQVRAGLGIEHDSNVLRQPDAVADTVGTASLGLRFDKRYSLQRFRADIEASTYRYQDHSELDYSTLNYNAAWDWSFTPKLHGVISAERRQYRETSADVVTSLNRVGRRTERKEIAEGIYELGAAWRVLAGVSHASSKSTEPNTWDASPTVRSVYAGAGYELGSGASITARFRRGDGEYTDPSAAGSGDFRENEADVLVKWPLTAKTSIEAALGHLDRSHSGTPQRDFSGLVGRATLNWEVTGKTRVMAGLAHDLTSTGQATGGRVEHNRVWIGPTWKPTAHTAVNLRYDHVTRSWRDVPGGSPDAGRRETTRAAMIGFDWEPRPSIMVSTYLRNERLKSNLSFAGYRATIYGIAGKVYF
jgi:exopolysaccharide biosynthesis operon protein EpsL